MIITVNQPKWIEDDLNLEGLEETMTMNDKLNGVVQLPYPATEKCRYCKQCKHMRLAHRSNPHYSCEIQHVNVEAKWTCKLYTDKKMPS